MLLMLGIGPLQVRRRGPCRRSAGAMMLMMLGPFRRIGRSKCSAGAMMLLMLGIGPSQVRRRGDDADDVGPLPADWAPAGGRSC